MLKVKLADGYPPEESRYVKGKDDKRGIETYRIKSGKI